MDKATSIAKLAHTHVKNNNVNLLLARYVYRFYRLEIPFMAECLHAILHSIFQERYYGEGNMNCKVNQESPWA